jgi:hypothetical protein
MAEDDLKVGYGRPPKANQFKAGRSGNPRGRPKGSRNLTSVLREQFYETHAKVTLDGKQMSLPKVEIACRQQVDKAAKGDTKSFMAIHQILSQGEERDRSFAGGSTHTEISEEAYASALAALVANRSLEASDASDE